MKIVEVFASVQGEGLRQGEPTLFVRLAGCNLRCLFCDTKRARHGGRVETPARVIRLLKAIRRGFPAAWVCLTGGEPLLQDLSGLMPGLHACGFKVQVETNGTLFQPVSFDWITLSPKPPAYSYQPRWRRPAKEVKLVVSRDLTWAVVERLRGEFPPGTPILLQPQSNRKDSRDKALRLLRRSMKAGLPNLRLTLQLHKIYKIR